jgi:hypothetical protein
MAINIICFCNPIKITSSQLFATLQLWQLKLTSDYQGSSEAFAVILA